MDTGEGKFKELDKNDLKDLKNTLTDFFLAVSQRLGEKYEEGYRGWNGDYDYHKLAIELNKDSIELIKENDPVKAAIDIGARAMMLWYRHTKKIDVGQEYGSGS